MKKLVAALLLAFFAKVGFAQVLFTYGKYTADVKDFTRAYNKSNGDPYSNNKLSVAQYLDLYIASKLKVQEAINRGYDTLPNVKAEVENLRSQVIDNYLADTESKNKLITEAFKRSQKEIHAAFIYTGFKTFSEAVDSIAAKNKIEEAYALLKKGNDFSATALRFSEDPAVKNTKGDMGFITVFSLPYEFENIIYNTPVGKFSAPVKTKSGYIIFKNIGERKALGKVQAAQILLAFPPESDAAAKKAIAKKADSVYQLILKGQDFGKLAAAVSNDYVSAANSGILPDFSRGQYDIAFENAVYGLTKNNAVSKPFETAYGIHIVKRLAIKPIVTDEKNAAYKDELRIKVEQDSRIESTKDVLANNIIKQAGFSKNDYKDEMLWKYTDSILDYKPAGITLNINGGTSLFKLGNKAYTASNWTEFAQTARFKPDGSGKKQYKDVMDEFIRAKALDYYKDHLEEFNEEFRNNMNEFKDGNLIFEIMQQDIWNKAQTDTAALAAWYEKNKAKYMWKKSADAVVFMSGDEPAAKILYNQLKTKPAEWKNLSDALSEKIIADSGRFETDQIPGLTPTNTKAGALTNITVNKNDNTTSFAYIVNIYNQPTQRSFAESKGIVIGEYQEELERNFLQRLKEKYPVKIDDKVLKSIPSK
jgi:peptidyl-prolyl cis-trans isomerase SurA